MARKDTDKKSIKSNRPKRFKLYANVKPDIFNMKFPDQDQVHVMYPAEYLAQLSKLFDRTVDSNMLHLFKDAYGRHFVLERVPLSAQAVKQCKDDVRVFISHLLIGDYGLTSAILHELMYRVNGSNDRDLQILFNAYLVIYYRATNKLDEYEQAMALLEDSRDEFTDEHRYWYHREQGIIRRYRLQYKSAVFQFLKAEEYIKHTQVSDRGLYINIAYCLTYMQFPIDAIEYLDESERLAAKGFISSSKIYVQLLYATNYANMGDAAKSLALLKGLSRDEMDTIIKERYNVHLHFCFANAYQELGEYEKAIDSIDDAIRYAQINKSGAEYKYHIYTKLFMMNKFGKINACNYELYDALETESDKEKLTDLLLNTLKHSFTLDREESLSFVEDYAIDKILSYGLNIQAIEYHKKLCTFYSTVRKGVKGYEKALHHSLEIEKIRVNLSKKGGYRS